MKGDDKEMPKTSLNESQSQLIREYLQKVRSLIDTIVRTQSQAIESAANLIAESILAGGTVHYTGCGHSSMLAVEMVFRCGALAIANAILEPSLMLHEKPLTKGAKLEKLHGYGQIIIDSAPMERYDTLVVISNSGVNPVPVEMALTAKQRGHKVIALTSLQYTTSVPALHSSGKKLHKVADVVLDNCGVLGDAILEIEGFPARVGPTSTIAGAFILIAVHIRAIQVLLENGLTPPVLMSGQMPEAEAWNERLFLEWDEWIRY